MWSSRVVLVVVERGLFTDLAQGPATAKELMGRLGWHPRATAALLDCLVALGLLKCDRNGRYSNSLRASLFLDRNSPATSVGSWSCRVGVSTTPGRGSAD
ncbi:methyltransferase family protein [Mycolicibacterium wolinskyi]|uniref:methyltransferase family protein n=1 Tax=Mycolicibacterium wolinskyi TaxID=59750 RepID=UPI0039176CAE